MGMQAMGGRLQGVAPGINPGQMPEIQLPTGGFGGLPQGAMTGGGGKGGNTGVAKPSFQVGAGTRPDPVIPDETGGRVPVSPAAGQTTGTPNMFQASSQSIYDAMAGARDIMGYQPLNVSSGYQPMNVAATGYDPSTIGTGFNLDFERVAPSSMEAAQTTQADIDRFYNPYTTQVIDQSMADIERNRLMQANQAAAQAQAAGAFGGSRGALMEAEIARNALEQQARTGGQLRQQGFATAAQLAQQDVARRQQAGTLNAQQALQAALANQATGLQAGMANQQAGLQASLANQAAMNAARSGFSQQQLQAALANQAAGLQGAGMDLQAALANQSAGLQGAGMRLGAGTQLANLGNLGFNQAQTALQGMQQQGLLQQMLMQSLMDKGAGQYGAYSNQIQNKLGMLTSALSGVPIPSSTTQRGTPGLVDMATSGAMIYALLSDIRLKDDIQKIGELENGLGVYTWRWNEIARNQGVETPEIGVLAQEVAKVIPSAVFVRADGYLMVDYGQVL
jgi:hypothetical protein